MGPLAPQARPLINGLKPFACTTWSVQHLQQALQRQAVPHHAHEVQPRAGSHQRRAQVFGVQQKLPVQERQTFTPCEGTRIVLSFLLNTLFHEIGMS